MKISLNWINDYVDLSDKPVDEIVKRFTLSTAEIENVEQVGYDVSGVVFAKIIDVKEHPNSTKLHILQVDKGDEVVQIVCGAPNVRVGMITCLATLGANVKGMKIKPAKLAGVESFGMCCGENELGIGGDTSGIIDVKENVKIGQDIKEVWQIEDTIIEIDNKSLTNRPDLWGHYGIAREFAAIFNKQLKPLSLENLEQSAVLPKIDIKINTDKCLRYSAISFANVTEKQSPQYIKIRLNYIEQRDINLLADLTNYVMFDIGQPMHAFDNSKVDGIVVDVSNGKEKILTLENEYHDIPNGALTIYNKDKTPVALAGIKGGLLSSISNDTTSLLLESANFDSATIRKASIGLGLRTLSSLRYEKTLDPELTTIAIKRFIKLAKQIDAGIVITSSLSDNYVCHYPKVEINTSFSFLSNRIGYDIDKELTLNILKKLEFDVTVDGDKLNIKIPSFRATKDISLEADIVEEVARLIGYDKISPVPFSAPIIPVRQDDNVTKVYEIKKLLAEKFGFNEVHSYIWNYEDFNKTHNIDTETFVCLLDTSNSGQSGIRSRLMPTMIKIFDENKSNFNDIAIFEVGEAATGLNEDNLVCENTKLAVLLASKTDSDEKLYFKLKEIMDTISSNILHNAFTYEIPANDNLMHAINSCKILNSDNESIGNMGLISPLIKLDGKFYIAILEIDIKKLLSIKPLEVKINAVSKYQEVSLDFNFLVDSQIDYATFENAMKEFKCNFLMTYALKDIYIDELKLKDKISYTINVKIAAKDRTLTSKDIDNFSFRFVDHMKKRGYDLKQ